MQVAVTRAEPGSDRGPFLPEQALDLATAFAAYTSGSASVNHRDLLDGAGVLREGAVADLVVLDRDPFAHPAEEIADARVISTWIEGTPVYTA
jgi:predicted amidohydrolase YtcJ